MVSIDPNCPRHGKYSLTAWLRKQGTKVEGVKVGARHQIVSKLAKESKNLNGWKVNNKRVPETGNLNQRSATFSHSVSKIHKCDDPVEKLIAKNQRSLLFSWLVD